MEAEQQEKPLTETKQKPLMDERRLGRLVKGLPHYQRDILREAKTMERGALCLPMGSGKTLLGLLLGLRCHFQSRQPFLVVCAKNLISSWRDEIRKHFGDYTVPYVSWLSSKDIALTAADGFEPMFALTTPDTVTKAFKELALRHRFVEKEQVQQGGAWDQLRHDQLRFRCVEAPLLAAEKGQPPPSLLFNREWSCVVVDEAHQYLNIRTQRTQALCSLWAPSQWLLSGTLFDEPDAEKLMGFLFMLHDALCPATIADMKKCCKRKEKASGVSIRPYCVVRKENLMWQERPPLEEVIVTTPMTGDELLLYQQLKQAIQELAERIQLAKDNDLPVRGLSTSLMSMMTYLRMCLVVPLSLLSNLLLKCVEQSDGDGEERGIMRDVCRRLQRNVVGRIDLGGEDVFYSTRVREVVALVRKHEGERVVVFSAFQCLLNVVQHFVKRELPQRRVLRLTGAMTSDKRGEQLRLLERSEDGVMLMTFQLGGTGLNLQCATVCVVMDFWWNSGMTRQAMARIMRFGQRNKVTTYLLTSNTSFELELFRLHLDKKEKCEQIMAQEQVQGLERTKCTLSFDKIVELVRMQDSVQQLQQLL